MLKRLYVRNYVLIEELDISFGKGMSIITGETGAGKSILLGALGLILGQRADAGALQNKTKKCIIEGTFNIAEYKLQSFFTENELDYEEETTIRREISAEGKSRAFINDTPVTLAILKDLSSRLVDIHSQHETLLLNSNKFQLNVVDEFARNQDRLAKYSDTLATYNELKKSIEIMKEEEAKSKADFDYFNFQLNELSEANLSDPDELSSLEQEQERLENAEEIKLRLSQGFTALSGSDDNMLVQLKVIQQQIAGLAKFDKTYEEIANRIKSSLVELKDISDELERAEEAINSDNKRLEIIQDRLSLLYKLQQKHRVEDLQSLITLQAELADKVFAIGTLEDRITAKTKELEELHTKLEKDAAVLTEARKKAIPQIEKEITGNLGELAMQGALLRIALIPNEENRFTADGAEKVHFLFSANKGGDFKEISKVASGGELSRLMLCIKALMAKLTSMPTVIFDEIDTGISGETASKVGSIIKQMAAEHQVIAITHLPQMAGKGHHHYFVYKTETKGKTHTHLKILSTEERITEIARMLSGETLTEAALGNAKALLSLN